MITSEYESKYYEYGVLRSLGFMKQHLVQIVTFKSLTMSAYGIALGILTAYLLNILIRIFISLYLGYTMTYNPSVLSIVIGTLLGLIIPLISNYVPVK